ncbi:hypothetical protein SR42_00455 [Clostridium botulinum]|uniref:DUF927 domain-containing protein n=1 Tax=Clostridium botulinum TaxID=1491 RepID=UPI000597579E|nr:DUF927 domain-containing protein [Clostridium botulinum]KIL07557.1 hypothetical protein SR42_00455 [Clostridium botulinum]MBY6935441.1 DUF927 domain-containing protein [Clostridium botulinum]NFL82183.1 DUF927 domain-containing protein [Clostridium botulinum]NFN12605.1 DUF927 domain-containing protein [Clostridium botulinum]NFO37771.1 DUF927 domain-containing protein [Clostridium botulinum]
MNSNKLKSIIITEQLLMQGKTYRIGYKELSDDGLYALNKQDDGTIKKIKICEDKFVQETVENLDTGEHYLILVNKSKRKYVKKKYPMDILIPQKLIGLLKYGVDIPAEHEKALSRYLLEQQKLVPYKLVYNNIGWNQDENKDLEFRIDRLISNNSSLVALNDKDNLKFNLSRMGSLERWLEMYCNEIKGHIPLEAIICISFSAVIVGYLNKMNKDVDTLIIHLAGKSTTGKTTASKAALSVFGLPDTKNKGLLRTWNATTNAMINSLGGNFGVPLEFDELSMVNQRTITKELYKIASGLEKARLSDSITQRSQQAWATTIISTGEQSLFEKTNHNAGLRVIAISFEGAEWTKSAENAENIKAVINENYGHAGAEFVKYIFGEGFQIIDSKFKFWRARALEVMPESGFKDRIANKFATILTAGDMANEALGLEIDLEGVLNFLSENEAENIKERDFAEKAFTDMVQVIIQNISRFKTSSSYSTPSNCWGRIENGPGYYQVMVLQNVLKNKLIELNNEDPKIVIKEWKSKGYLISEDDRATIRRHIFTKDEQQERKESLGKTKVSKDNLADTVYILKVPRQYLQKYLVSNTLPSPVP